MRAALGLDAYLFTYMIYECLKIGMKEDKKLVYLGSQEKIQYTFRYVLLDGGRHLFFFVLVVGQDDEVLLS